jgi:hypothetical protein
MKSGNLWSTITPQFEISQRIWLILSVFIVISFISLIMGFLINRDCQERTALVSRFLFPANMQSLAAQHDFDELIRQYMDGVVLGDQTMILSGQAKGIRVRTALDSILKLPEIDAKTSQRIHKIIRELDSFTGEAQRVYLP